MTNCRRDAQRGPRGMEPAGRHGTPSPDARPSPRHARRSLGRLVVTPTFAAGACILFAAVLAYGTTQTHLAFRGLGPACGGASCSAAGPGQAGAVRPHGAGAPGRTDANGHVRSHAAPDPGANANAGRLAGNMSSVAASPGLPVVIAYRTVRRWDGGFTGMMTITNRSRSAIPDWLLFVRYRRARMHRVWGARWHPVGPHGSGAGVVAPRPDQLVLRPGASAEFTFRASGHFGPPAGCFFDNARCRFHRSG
jgi:Cellulose binding domain